MPIALKIFGPLRMVDAPGTFDGTVDGWLRDVGCKNVHHWKINMSPKTLQRDNFSRKYIFQP